MTTVEIDKEYTHKPLPEKLRTIGIALLIIGLLLGAVLFIADTHRALYNYLLTFFFLLSISLGALFLVALEYLAGADWSVPIRRVVEFFAAGLPILLILSIPLLFNIGSIFEWAHEEIVAADKILMKKVPYLNTTFFIIRVFFCFALWILFYFLIIRNSKKQDTTGDQKFTKKNIFLSAIFIPIFAITITIAGVDWLMSIEPHWFSTIFGVYVFSGSVVGTLAAVTLAVVLMMERGYLHPKMTKHHLYSLGGLMFGFINFWAYIAFSQFLLIWYANLPETTFYFIDRWETSPWLYVSILLIVFHFVVPYAVLLSQEAKMNPKKLKFISVWLLVAHLIDLYWLTMPSFHKHHGGEHGSPFLVLLEIGLPVAAAGFFMLLLYYKSKKNNLVPVGDPKLKRGIDFHL